METQADVSGEFEALIPTEIQEKFAHLSYAEMAAQPECSEWESELLEFEQRWFAASDA